MIHKDIFTDGECQFLLDSITFHHDLLDEDKNTLKQKLLFWASCPQQKRLISFPSKGKELHFSLFINLTTIMKAIENKKMITFQYINYDIYKETLHEILHNMEILTINIFFPLIRLFYKIIIIILLGIMKNTKNNCRYIV